VSMFDIDAIRGMKILAWSEIWIVHWKAFYLYRAGLLYGLAVGFGHGHTSAFDIGCI